MTIGQRNVVLDAQQLGQLSQQFVIKMGTAVGTSHFGRPNMFAHCKIALTVSIAVAATERVASGRWFNPCG